MISEAYSKRPDEYETRGRLEEARTMYRDLAFERDNFTIIDVEDVAEERVTEIAEGMLHGLE